MRLLGINGSLTPSSRTREVVRLVLDQAATDPAVEPELLDLGAYDIAFCDGRDPSAYTGDTRTVIDKIAAADAYVVGTPSYRGSYTGALKNLFDLVPNEAPRGKVAGIVLTAGSDHHFLAIEHQLRPLLSFFQMQTVPGAVYAQNIHFTDGELTDPAIRESCRRLGAEIVRLWRAAGAGDTGPAYPVITRKPGDGVRPTSARN
jgi:MsuE subfamily FMN reductase